MLTLFYNKLIYKHWLVNQFTLINDVINVLQLITYKIGKIRYCSQPPFDDIKDRLDRTYIVYRDIVFRRWYQSPYKQRDFNYCKINDNITAKGGSPITYCYKDKVDYCNNPLYLDLEVDLPLSNIDSYDVITGQEDNFIFY